MWFAAGLICYMAIGGALGLMAPTARAANAIGNLLFLPTFLLAGGGPPRGVMSGPMQTISDLIPLSHVTSGLRREWLGATDAHIVAWWPVLVCLVAVAAAIWVARRRAA
jgi:ABC-2 type transport system permease protein